MRHGKPTEVTLRNTLCDLQVRVTVEDNGLGFTHTAALTGGHGSGNIATRMTQIGGTFERRSVPGQGTVVVLAIHLTDYLA